MVKKIPAPKIKEPYTKNGSSCPLEHFVQGSIEIIASNIVKNGQQK